MDWLDIKEFIKDTFSYILVFAIVLLTIIYVFSFVQVIGPSMKPTLNEGNITVILKSHYRLFDVKRQDIIAFEYEDTKYLIKRVIGLPGDTVEIKNNIVYINDTPLEEKYTSKFTEDYNFKLQDIGYDVIPDNYYFVLGDNREDSLDSRDFGLVKKDTIQGRIIFKLYPFSEINILK